MDRIIIKPLPKKAIIQKCGTCIYGKNKNLQNADPPAGWVYCIMWMGNKPFSGLCSEWKS